MTAITATAWQDSAACRTADPNVFFAPEAETDHARTMRERAARRYCNGCPVWASCLDFAEHVGAKHGTWGGLTPGERQPGKRRARRRAARQDTAA